MTSRSTGVQSDSVTAESQAQIQSELQDLRTKIDALENATTFSNQFGLSGSHPDIAAIKIQLKLLEE